MRLPIPRRFAQVAYLGQQTALQVSCGALQHLLRRIVFGQNPELRFEAVVSLRRRYFDLVRQDLANVDAGYYPADLLFQIPWGFYLRRLPKLGRDLPRVFRRIRQGNWRDLPPDVDVRSYPAYYRRTFHWQTDGYLSRHSAELYDLGVEFLFGGAADVMRRQLIPPVVEHLGGRAKPCRILDVACGTGRTLTQIARSLPNAELTGLDLSPYYLDVARTALAGHTAELVAANAEDMPFESESFDIVTSVYLFHELPRNARRRVWNEMLRVLRPGGLLIIMDSIQNTDARDLAFFLGRFDQEMHEPFYRDYLGDDLATGLTDAGFEIDAPADAVWLSKRVVARRPRASAAAA